MDKLVLSHIVMKHKFFRSIIVFGIGLTACGPSYPTSPSENSTPSIPNFNIEEVPSTEKPSEPPVVNPSIGNPSETPVPSAEPSLPSTPDPILPSPSLSESPKEEHQMNKVERQEPTYTKDGNIEYYYCEHCDTYFQDEHAAVPLIEEDLALPATTPFRQKETQDGLKYCEYTPKASQEKKPLVLFLHGVGECGSDNELQLKNGILKAFEDQNSPFYQAYVIAPQCPEGEQWVDYSYSNGNYRIENVAESSVMQKVVSLVENYRAMEEIDADRIYVMGLSMGGYGTWDIISRHTDLFAAAVPICGGGPLDAVGKLLHLPIYAFHGTKDSTVAYQNSVDLIQAITDAGGKEAQLVSFEGVGHNAWDKAFTYDSLFEWMFSKVRKDKTPPFNIEDSIGFDIIDETF